MLLKGVDEPFRSKIIITTVSTLKVLVIICIRKDIIAAQREYKKKKTQKKVQKLKQQEEERETDKNKWLSFNARVSYAVCLSIVTHWLGVCVLNRISSTLC